jgi:DNA invertase Pin-like site-specific DNA recombinase
MKYVIYLRVSTKKQDSRNQLENCLQYLQSRSKEGFNYLVFSDEITSKRSVYTRKGFQETLRALQEGDVLVAMRLDRIARYCKQLNWVADKIEEKKASFLMVEQPGLDNMILWGIYAGMAEEEVKTMGQRVKEALNAKKSRGELTNISAPYGFAVDTENLIPIKNRDEEGFTLKVGKLIENPREKQIIREMLYLFDGGKSYQAISNELAKLGYLNRKGRPFQKMSIQRILVKIGKNRHETRVHDVREDLLFHS